MVLHVWDIAEAWNYTMVLNVRHIADLLNCDVETCVKKSGQIKLH